MVTYKERKENLHYFVLTKGGEVIATFGNLKRLSEFVKDEDSLSYHTLVRKKKFPIQSGQFQIWKVKHY